MEKINCNVIQDILPLYIDNVVSDDTKELVEEHLQNCEICQRVYHETKTDLENDMKISAQTKESSHEANDLKSFRKFLKKRKIKTILLSIAATVICFVAVFTFMNKHVTYISYKDAGITIIEDNKDEVTYRTNIKITNKTKIIWTSSNTNIVSTNKHKITAHHKGLAIITLTIKDRTVCKKAICTIRVT